jgi:MFS family permease
MPEFVNEFISNIVHNGGGMVIFIACFVIGEIIKSAFCDKIPNKYIPLIAAVLGGLLVLVIPTAFSDLIIGTRIIYGVLCGWASTGAYESIKNLFKKENVINE